MSSIDEGAAPTGTFDHILLEGAVEELPAGFAAALAPHGRLGTALSDRGVTRLAVGTAVGGALAFRTFADADVAPLVAYQRPRAFSF